MDARIKTADESSEITDEDKERSSEGVVVNSLLSSTEILELPLPYPFFGDTNMVYIREAYTEIYEKYIETHKHTLIVGNPGTGKSLFLPYIVYRVLREHPEDAIIYRHCSMTESVIYIKGKEACVLSPHLCDATCYYCLYDCGQLQLCGLGIDVGLAWKATKSIVFSSPEFSNYNRYHKDCIQSAVVLGAEVVLLTWSWDELKFVRNTYIHI